jgi:hypothetical protein
VQNNQRTFGKTKLRGDVKLDVFVSCILGYLTGVIIGLIVILVMQNRKIEMLPEYSKTIICNNCGHQFTVEEYKTCVLDGRLVCPRCGEHENIVFKS